MNNAINIADQKERLRALDPATSFIVQAPAGSGKTGLLTQRYIMLLAGVDAPEEIVAITFTRKAAAEMRDRILQALAQANSEQPPDEAHEKHTWELARKAIARDREKGWQLLNNPGRLRIQTIDSLCTSLSRQMPVLSQFGSVPAITDDAEALYLEAAINTIADLESNEQWSDSISHLIQHLDSRLVTLQGLISTMLAKRDQWLRHVANPANPGLIRSHLELAIIRIIEEALSDLSAHVPKACEAELLALARFAAGNVAEPDSLIAACLDLKNLPGFSLEDRQQWEGLAELLLTADGNWRKRLTKKEGFPAPSTTKDKEEKALYTDMKQRMSDLLESLHDSDDFSVKLVQLRMLPSHQYKEEEWETLQALFELLRLAAAHLEIVFSERGQVDFPALAQAAIRALGEPDAPTDLALALDYRIRHLLVDEFQDTAVNQYKLIEGLTAGWQPDDGHTLFVVGDPMQSIYRFREAEVSRFLDARLNGIGQVSLEFLRLSVNFRSQQGIVDWVNEKFPLILPQEDDIASAAVSYAESESFHTPLQGAAAIFYASVEKDYAAEATKIVSIVKQAKAEYPEGRTAILVRGRTHLVDIVAQLQQANIGFQAVEIERLQHRQIVQDLSALTRALYYRHDRIAWLSILRAPYCGLTLNDLNILAGDDKYQTIITLLQQQERIDRLSEDGRCRLERVLPILEAALTAQSRCQLRTYVEGTWIALGGPACVTDETDLEDAEVYFQLLETLDDAGDAPDSYALNKKLEKLFALPDVEADSSLQIMTIHKAKGLEFDSVILPGLGRKPRNDDKKLLYWLERPNASGGSDLILAPINAQGEDTNPMAAYLQDLDKEKRRNEDGRLLYVAATRAKKRLHLLGHVDFKEKEGERILGKPPGDSLLARLWTVVEDDFQSALASYSSCNSAGEKTAPRLAGTLERTRLATGWSLPAPPSSSEAVGEIINDTVGDVVEFGWAGETARHVGTVVHRLLQRIGETGIENIGEQELHTYEAISRSMLSRLGVSEAYLQEAVEKTKAALRSTFESQRGRWILSNRHQQEKCELALSGVHDERVMHMIIDRTFIDEEGTRWIIDYKTGGHAGGGLDEFLDREQERYSQQLQAYARVMRKLEKSPIRLGLYFPLLGGWREWSF